MSDLTRHWALEPGLDFLNHGSFGACPTAVLAVQDDLRRLIERQPMTFFVRELRDRIDAARAAIAGFVGADPEDTVFVRNASAGVNAVLRSLRFDAGDELLQTDHGYNACKNALTWVAERWGARAVTASVPYWEGGLDEDAVVAAVLGAVTERTKLALLDHITSPTGLVLPIERLVRELADRGVDTLVDAAHAPGHVPLDVAAIGAAYYTANCHKWLCAPKGAAILVVRRDRREGLVPTVVSHGYGEGGLHPQFDWIGTDDPTPWLCVPACLEVIGGLVPGGWPAVMRRNHELALRGREILAEALDAEPLSPASMVGCLAAVPLPATDWRPGNAWELDPLQQALLDAHRIEVPIVQWPGDGRRLVRISAYLYNEEAQYRRLAAALVDELARGL